MLRLLGSPYTCCDGLTRRSWLKVGLLGLGGMSLADLLREQAARGAGRSNKAVIFVELAGGPTHFETYDPKPDAPEEYRGPLGTIATKLPGVQFSELMEKQAAIADQLAVIRSIAHTSSSHGTSAHLTQTGYYLSNPQKRENDMPCAGAVAARDRGPNAPGMPAFVSIPQPMRFGGPAYLGKQFAAFATGADPVAPDFTVNNLSPAAGIDLARLNDRRGLLAALDEHKRVVDPDGVAASVDQFGREATEMVTNGRARKAFDIAAEPQAMRDRYGMTSAGQGMLLARRLVEAGVTFVTVRVQGWDDHTNIKEAMQRKGPAYDQAIAALVSDLHDRGLDREVMVVSMGEFGRTPRVNKSAGRDHWGAVMSVLMAGGGLKAGQIVGASNDKGEIPADRPYRPENVLATIYRHLGIDTALTFNDLSGRPRYVLENRGVISELV